MGASPPTSQELTTMLVTMATSEQKRLSPMFISSSSADKPTANASCCTRVRWALLFRAVSVRWGLYLGETMGVCIAVLFGVYWFFNRLSAKDEREVPVARAFSSLALVGFAGLFFPVTRKSVLSAWFGVSFERAVRYHRWLAIATMGFVSLHGALMLERFGSDVLKTESLTGFPHPPLYGVLAWLTMLVMCGTALSCVRRRWFETFYFTHHIFVVVLILGTLHVRLLPLWAGPGITLYIVDRILRRCRRSVWSKIAAVSGKCMLSLLFVLADTCFGTCVVQHDAKCGVSRVNVQFLPAAKIAFSPGQYVFVNIPCVSKLQWHPLSISSSPSELPQMTLHLKTMAAGSFTSKVAALSTPEIYLDGPYGSLPTRLGEYTTFVLFAGGIGVTPMLSVAKHLRGRSHICPVRVLFVWSFRGVALAEMFSKSIRPLASWRGCDMRLFNTSTEEISYVDSCECSVQQGRPLPSQILQSLSRLEAGASPVAVMTCGPYGLTNAVEKACVTASAGDRVFHCHSETFKL